MFLLVLAAVVVYIIMYSSNNNRDRDSKMKTKRKHPTLPNRKLEIDMMKENQKLEGDDKVV